MKKPGLAELVIAMGKPKKPADDSEEVDESSDSDVGLEECADELIKAIKDEDPKAVAAAFKDMMDVCHSEHEED